MTRLIHVFVELALSRLLPEIVHENDFDRVSCHLVHMCLDERSLGPSRDESITSHKPLLTFPIEPSDHPWVWLACLIRMYIWSCQHSTHPSLGSICDHRRTRPSCLHNLNDELDIPCHESLESWEGQDCSPMLCHVGHYLVT